MVEALLEYRADANARRRADGMCPLMWAVSGGHVNTVNALLAGGANPNLSRTTDDVGPLMIACACGHMEVVKALLDAGANMHATRRDGANALVCCCEAGQLALVEFLLSRDRAHSLIAHDGRTPVHAACALPKGEQRSSSVPIVEALLKYDETLADKRTRTGVSPLMVASEAGSPFSQALFHRLIWCWVEGNMSAIKCLLAHGATVNALNSTALVWALRSGHSACAEVLLDAGASFRDGAVPSEAPDWVRSLSCAFCLRECNVTLPPRCVSMFRGAARPAAALPSYCSDCDACAPTPC